MNWGMLEVRDMDIPAREELGAALPMTAGSKVVYFDFTSSPPTADGEYFPSYIAFGNGVYVSLA
jgi:hypothetical protein